MGGAEGSREAVGKRRRVVHLEAVLAEARGEYPGLFAIVFDEQEAHEAKVGGGGDRGNGQRTRGLSSAGQRSYLLRMDPSQTYDLLRNLTTPIVAITSARNGKLNAMITDGAVRCSIVPDIPRVLVQINALHLTHEFVCETGRFALHLLHADQVDLVTKLGFVSGRDAAKLAGIPHRIGATGCPILDDCYAWFDCTVINHMETGISTVFLGQVMDVGRGRGEEVLTPARLRAALPAAYYDQYVRQLAEAQDRARPLAWRFRPTADATP